MLDSENIEELKECVEWFIEPIKTKLNYVYMFVIRILERLIK